MLRSQTSEEEPRYLIQSIYNNFAGECSQHLVFGWINNNFQLQMSIKGSPIRGLEPNIKEFTLENYALNTENQRLTQLLISKNLEIKTLVENNSKLKSTYQAQANAYRRTIDSLQKQLNESEQSRNQEFEEISNKYKKLTQEEMSSLKYVHTTQVEFLFKQIAQLRASIETYKSKLDVKDHENNTLKASYERELAVNTSEINSLSKKLIQLEDDKLKEIKDLTNRRELQKSRTSGIVNSRKQSNLFIEKQLRKLNQEVLQKTISIENTSRELLKEKKKSEEIEKSMNKKLDALTQDYEAQLKEKEVQFLKIQKILKQEILEYKQKEIKLLGENQTLKSNINLLKKEVQAKQTAFTSKCDQVALLKQGLERLKQDHMNQINNLMKERRKRSSKSNLGSSRSLTSSLKESAIMPQPSPTTPLVQNEQIINKFPTFLPTVKEENSPERKQFSQELSHSNIVEQDNQDQLARAVSHYETIIDQLKKNHQLQIDYMDLNLNKLKVCFTEKQNELQEVLSRFSPLVKIHHEGKSLQEDRKERIQRHWKADIAILEIMLKKYKIRTF